MASYADIAAKGPKQSADEVSPWKSDSMCSKLIMS
jgi:hypothetical protein